MNRKKKKSEEENNASYQNISTKFSENYLKELERSFKVFDKNGDGKITTEELYDVMQAMGYPVTDEQVKKIISKSDTNQNGTVEFNEFVVMMENCAEETYPEPQPHNVEDNDIIEIFRAFDINRDGFISANEIKQTMVTMGEHLSDEDIQEMVRTADVDGNNLIDITEFKSLLQNIHKNRNHESSQ